VLLPLIVVPLPNCPKSLLPQPKRPGVVVAWVLVGEAGGVLVGVLGGVAGGARTGVVA
jgi:hypothetical protein